MNCRDFEKDILVLTGNKLLDSATEERLLNHTDGCKRCAAYLEAEQSLLAGFRAVIDDISTENVPSHIEANLLAAFHSQAAQKTAPNIENIRNPIRYWWQTRWAFAVIAVIILVCLVSIRQLGSNPKEQQNQRDLQAYTIRITPPDSSFPQINEPVSSEPPKVYKQMDIRKRKPLYREIKDTSRVKIHPIFKKSVMPKAQDEARFFPLAEADEFVPLESGQLVRVEVSTASLIKLGVPFKADKGNQSVQADLLIGQDGIARAIRPVE